MNFNSVINPGQEITINNSNVGDDEIKNFVTLNNYKFANNQTQMLPPLTAGDYNNDYNNDYF